MNGLSELIDSLEVKFFKLNQKLIQLEKKNSELQEELLRSKKMQQQQAVDLTSFQNQLDTSKKAKTLI
jgi:hypothetical protein